MVSIPQRWVKHFRSLFYRDTISKESAASVPGWVQDFLYLTAVLNSCINPVVYGHYYHGERRGRHRESTVVSNLSGRQDIDRQLRMKRLKWNREDRVRITINNNSDTVIWSFWKMLDKWRISKIISVSVIAKVNVINVKWSVNSIALMSLILR